MLQWITRKKTDAPLIFWHRVRAKDSGKRMYRRLAEREIVQLERTHSVSFVPTNKELFDPVVAISERRHGHTVVVETIDSPRGPYGENEMRLAGYLPISEMARQ